jgi:hypothetical protein
MSDHLLLTVFASGSFVDLGRASWRLDERPLALVFWGVACICLGLVSHILHKEHDL